MQTLGKHGSFWTYRCWTWRSSNLDTQCEKLQLSRILWQYRFLEAKHHITLDYLKPLIWCIISLNRRKRLYFGDQSRNSSNAGQIVVTRVRLQFLTEIYMKEMLGKQSFSSLHTKNRPPYIKNVCLCYVLLSSVCSICRNDERNYDVHTNPFERDLLSFLECGWVYK